MSSELRPPVPIFQLPPSGICYHNRGGYMTCGWTGVCHPVFRKLPSSNYRLLPTAAVIPTFMMNFGGKLPIFDNFCQFLENPPMFMENLPKKGPLFREFWAQKPTHMGGTYPYPQLVMLPPPPGIIILCVLDLCRGESVRCRLLLTATVSLMIF